METNSRDRISVWTRFSASVETDRETHLASYTMGTWSFSGLRRLQRCVNHQRPSSAEVKESVKLYFYFPSAPH